MAYDIEFAEPVRVHLRALTARQRVAAIEAIELQLKHEPMVETRNRKPLRPNPLAPWELRVGKVRVFYDVNAATGLVLVVAVGVKERNILRVGGREVQL